jgi:hypothetical protein
MPATPACSSKLFGVSTALLCRADLIEARAPRQVLGKIEKAFAQTLIVSLLRQLPASFDVLSVLFPVQMNASCV